jgi:hypothetical protein
MRVSSICISSYRYGGCYVSGKNNTTGVRWRDDSPPTSNCETRLNGARCPPVVSLALTVVSLWTKPRYSLRSEAGTPLALKARQRWSGVVTLMVLMRAVLPDAKTAARTGRLSSSIWGPAISFTRTRS